MAVNVVYLSRLVSISCILQEETVHVSHRMVFWSTHFCNDILVLYFQTLISASYLWACGQNKNGGETCTYTRLFRKMSVHSILVMIEKTACGTEWCAKTIVELFDSFVACLIPFPCFLVGMMMLMRLRMMMLELGKTGLWPVRWATFDEVLLP